MQLTIAVAGLSAHVAPASLRNSASLDYDCCSRVSVCFAGASSIAPTHDG